MVSECLARRLWGPEEPLGQVLEDFQILDKQARVTVIGVVSDTVSARLQEILTSSALPPVEAACRPHGSW